MEHEPSDGMGADFADILAAFSRVSAAGSGLEGLLTQVASIAVQAIPGADGAGFTLLEADRADTIVKGEPFVREIDDIQYGLVEGPCVSAAAMRQTMRSGSLGGDSRWPRFGPRAGRLGVHSVLSLPLLSGDAVVGAMNVYAHAKDAFDDRACSWVSRSRCPRRSPCKTRRSSRKANGWPRSYRRRRPTGRRSTRRSAS